MNGDKPNRIPQIYGYTVCLIAVVAFLISINGVVDATFTLANPMHGPYGHVESLASFEAYEATRTERTVIDRNAPVDTTSEETRRRRFEALRTDRVAANRLQAWRRLVGSGLTMLIAIGLFAWHWSWLRARMAEERAAVGRAA
ncbi:MAG TPA: hypothetical protein VJ650_13395 [Gemmatimonadaceae bacterium]|nr:hypothetical protein [Gemmatimonadaceae bacterium]